MTITGRMVAGLAVLGLLGGCRVATQVKEVSRVDLQLERVGNRGYLTGTPPPARALKRTRQMVALTIEIPAVLSGGPPRAAGLEELAPPEIEMEQGTGVSLGGSGGGEAVATWVAPEDYDQYVVQKGNSLWSIAAKQEVYGKATQWRRIFDANRDVLTTPGDLQPGMTLRIPRGQDGGAGAGARYSK